jgi:hypothetical protein
MVVLSTKIRGQDAHARGFVETNATEVAFSNEFSL